MTVTEYTHHRNHTKDKIKYYHNALQTLEYQTFVRAFSLLRILL